MHRQPVGQYQFTLLDDGSFPFPARMFFANVPEDVWRAELQTDAQGKIAVGHNLGLLDDGARLILLDTGYGADTHAGRTGHMLEELERSGHGREAVDLVVFTHGHGDHIKGSTAQHGSRREPVFPRARYLLARADFAWFAGPGRTPEFDEHVGTLHALGRLDLFDAPCTLAPGVSLLPTPGHSPGHTSVLIESEGESVLFLGDVCHHPLHFAHPDWVSCFDTDPAVTPRTRASLFALALSRAALLVCPHAAAPGLGQLARNSNGYSWQALH